MCMTTAAIITVAVGAGSAVGGAAIAAHGQTKAAETNQKATEDATNAQLTASQQALDFQKQSYANTQQAVAPYQNMGAGALAALGQGLGVTPGNIAPTPISTGLHMQGATSETQNPDGTVSGTLPPGAGAQMANQTPAGFPNLTPEQQAYNQRQQSASLSQSGVRMQSPDGQETGIVAPNKVQYYLQQGAKVIQ